MNGSRAKKIRAHCDYDIKFERRNGRKYETKDKRICTGFRDDYRVFKRSIKKKRQEETSGTFINKTRRQAGIGTFHKKSRVKHQVEWSRR